MSQRDPLRVALAQLRLAGGDRGRNLELAAGAVAEARRAGAEVVVLPELVLTGFPPGRIGELAEPLDGPAREEFSRMAARAGVLLVAGMARRERGDAAVYNTTLVFAPDGELLATYDKTHLFSGERRVFTPGATLDAVFEWRGVRFGALCCFDIEFPEASRRLARLGAEVFLVPSANMEPWDVHHRAYVVARALENHAFVAYANVVGEVSGTGYVGGSCLVDPFGRVVCDAAGEERVVCGDADLELLARSRRTFDYLAERRPELYD